MARGFDTSDEALEWMAEQFGDARSRLDPATLAAITYYKGAGYRHLNDDLRDDAVDRFTPEMWLAITNAIASDRLTESVTVYRGIQDEDLAEQVLAGVVDIEHLGFVSVTLVESVAEGFLGSTFDVTDEEDYEPENLMLVADLPVGTDVAPVQLLVDNPATAHEAELLLHAGSRFMVASVDESDPGRIVVHGRWISP